MLLNSRTRVFLLFLSSEELGNESATLRLSLEGGGGGGEEGAMLLFVPVSDITTSQSPSPFIVVIKWRQTVQKQRGKTSSENFKSVKLESKIITDSQS